MAKEITLGVESVWPPLPDLNDKKNELIPQIDLYTSMKILDGFEFKIKGLHGVTMEPIEDTYFFTYRSDDQANFTAMSANALLVMQASKMTDEEVAALGVPVPKLNDVITGWRGWKDGVATTILLNTPQFMELVNASGAHKTSTLALGWLMKDDILSAADEAELNEKRTTYEIDEKYRWAKEQLGI